MSKLKVNVVKPLVRRIGTAAASYVAGVYSVVTPDVEQAIVTAIVALGALVAELVASAMERK